MNHPRSRPPTRIRLSDERRRQLLRSIQGCFPDNFDEPLGEHRAEGLLDFLVQELGPPIYNQGVRDAAAYVQEKPTDIGGEVYERDSF